MFLYLLACGTPDKDDTAAPVADTDADTDTDTDTDSDSDTDSDTDTDTDSDTDTDVTRDSCHDGADDDGDGWTDADDPDCDDGTQEVGFGDDACNDGLDDDGDTFVDAADPECSSATVCSEAAPEGLGGEYDVSAAPIVIEGETIYDGAGQRLGSWGDLDADGQADLLVGRGEDNAWFFFPGPLSGSQVITTAPTTFDLGATAGTAGDLDGDGVPDLVLGTLGTGVYVFPGPLAAGAYDDTDAAIAFDPDSYEFGYAVDAGGDLTGDGAADLIVGSPTAGSGAGAAFVFAGPVPPGTVYATAAITTVEGDVAGGGAGTSVTALGDVDGDGVEDVAIGAWLVSDAAGQDGRVAFWLGPLPTGTVSTAAADFYVHGEGASDELGVNVAAVGDTNGDGVDDVLLSPLYNSTAGYDAGAAYLLFGGARSGDSAADLADVVWRGEAAQDFAGAAIAGAGDVDDDGLADVLIGAYANDRSASASGTAFLVYGGFTAASYDLSAAQAFFEGAEAGDAAGWSVAGGHDLDGTGFDDVVVGANRAGGASSNAGAAYAFGGGSR